MVRHSPDRMSLLSLIDVSQAAVDSSDQALKLASVALNKVKLAKIQGKFEAGTSDQSVKASFEAFTAAKIANIQAKTMHNAVTEAFLQEDRKFTEKIKPEENVTYSKSTYCESDDGSDDINNFVMLSTNKNPVQDIEDEASTNPTSTSLSLSSSIIGHAEGLDCNDIEHDLTVQSTDPNFFLLSSSGLGDAEGHECGMIGLYRKTEEKIEGHSVYIQDQEGLEGYKYLYKMFCDLGVWVVMSSWNGNVLLKASTPSQRPTSVKWQYYDLEYNLWQNDSTLTVTSHNERPRCECVVTICLRGYNYQDIMVDIDRAWSGVYRPNGRYSEGRPIFRNTDKGGGFVLFMYDGRWRVSTDSGAVHLCSRLSLSMCPASREPADWTYCNGIQLGEEIIVTCNCTLYPYPKNYCVIKRFLK